MFQFIWYTRTIKQKTYYIYTFRSKVQKYIEPVRLYAPLNRLEIWNYNGVIFSDMWSLRICLIKKKRVCIYITISPCNYLRCVCTVIHHKIKTNAYNYIVTFLHHLYKITKIDFRFPIYDLYIWKYLGGIILRYLMYIIIPSCNYILVLVFKVFLFINTS